MDTLTAFLDFTPPHIPFFTAIITILGAMVIAVPLCHKIGISPVLGYLIAGIAVGPHMLGIVTEGEGMDRLADMGVVFLLFTIGLHLSLERLTSMRRLVFGLGLAQVIVTAAVIAGIAALFGNSSAASILLGGCFAMSSTAIISQYMLRTGELDAPTGRAAFSTLIAQDIAVAPLLVLVTVLADGQASPGMEILAALVKSTAAILIIIVVGRYLLRPLYRTVSTLEHSPELFLALTLIVVLLTAAMTQSAGLSMELGAFLAGLILAETEYRKRIASDIKPFQGILLGLFFITVGMGIDLDAIEAAPWLLAASVIGLFILKFALLSCIARAFGFPWRQSMRVGLLLGQAGEFVFVIVAAAMAGSILPPETGAFMMLVTALSMAATPLALAIADETVPAEKDTAARGFIGRLLSRFRGRSRRDG